MVIRALGVALSPNAQKPLYNQWYAENVDSDEWEAYKDTYHPIDKVIRVKSGKGLILETPLFSAFAWNHSPLANHFTEVVSEGSEVSQLFIEVVDDRNFGVVEDDDIIGVYTLKKTNIWEFERKMPVKRVKTAGKVVSHQPPPSEEF